MAESPPVATPDRDPEPDASALGGGRFSTWLAGAVTAIEDGAASDVPCGPCTACCTSSQFVHIAPDEVDTLAHVPGELTFPAPGLPQGHVLLGYDERGHCPMLVDDACSIYAHRPRTCRTYDCRVFPATGIEPDDDKPQIGDQTRRWRFEVATDADRERLGAVRAAARFLHDRADDLDDLPVPVSPTQRASLVVELHRTFLRDGDEDRRDPERIEPDIATVREAIEHLTSPARSPGRRR